MVGDMNNNDTKRGASQTQQKDKPIRLYRYMGHRAAIRTIQARGFRVSRILGLNDPFEYSFGYEDIPAHEIKKALTERDDLRRFLNERFGVLCYSRSAHDPVLWSHYADHHRGIVFEVECTPEEVKKELIKINYSRERVCVPFACHKDRVQNLEKLRRIFTKMIRRKAPNWRYEREYRGVFDLRTCETRDGDYVWIPPKDFIKRVIIGIRSPMSPLCIRRTLDLNGFTATVVVKAKESYNKYKIEF